MRIAICEDQPNDAARLHALVDDYLKADGFEASIDLFPSGEALLEAFLPGKYQIIFMDYYLDGINGMKAAEMIRQADCEVSFIFITMAEHIGSGCYHVDAAYYLKKPLDKHGLERAMGKCRYLLDRFARCLEVSANWLPEKVRLRDVYYVEAIKQNILLYTKAGEIKTRMALSELMGKVDNATFIQCHRSYVVNFVNAAEVRDNFVVMKNGVQVPISRTYAEQTERAARRFVFDGVRH